MCDDRNISRGYVGNLQDTETRLRITSFTRDLFAKPGSSSSTSIPGGQGLRAGSNAVSFGGLGFRVGRETERAGRGKLTKVLTTGECRWQRPESAKKETTADGLGL
jgi:hypothetical protein